jgi:hypothetical protein
MTLPLRTLAPCPFCGLVVVWRLWDGTLKRFRRVYPHRSPVLGQVHHCASTTLDIGAARAAFAALHCGATDIQGHDHAASALPMLGAPTLKGMGAPSGSGAHRALFQAKTGTDLHAPERPGDNPTCQGDTRTMGRNARFLQEVADQQAQASESPGKE